MREKPEMGAQLSSRRIVVVGATGAVGRELVSILALRGVDAANLRLFASSKSAGLKLDFGSEKIVVEELCESSAQSVFKEAELVFFTAGSEISKRYVFKAAEVGAFVIDNSSVFRLREDVPLVIPEVNPQALELAKDSRVVANPNCTTAQLLVALKPLHDRYQIRRIILSTYQAVSGKGRTGIDALTSEVRRYVEGKPSAGNNAFGQSIAFNCLAQIGDFDADGLSIEEKKVADETRKILGDPAIAIAATCARVPVLNCHCESVAIETQRPITADAAREALQKAPSVQVSDDPDRGVYPTPIEVSGKDDVYVGRIRRDTSLPVGRHGLLMWIVGDNLRKGAALNAVQIAEAATARGSFS